jgi:nucleoid DNA-binding protein
MFQEIVARVSEDTHYTKREIRKILRTLARVMREAIASGRDVQLYGVGWIRNVYRPPMKGRNYYTGQPVDIPAGRRLRFRACDAMKDAVDRSKAIFEAQDLLARFGVRTDPEEKPEPKQPASRSKEILLGKRRNRRGKVRRGDRSEQGSEGKDGR